MSKLLEIIQNSDGDRLLVHFIGEMDGNADYSEISLVGVKYFEIDFSRISLINSTGVQSWVKFITDLPDHCELVLRKCSARIINQMNQFSGFLGNKKVRVESFFAPYYCESCDKGMDVLIKKEMMNKNDEVMQAPQSSCTQCGADLEFDSVASRYFSFIKRYGVLD
ncbi:MAG: hypothetical protein HOO06_13345 [Bdellovibrionaceae bacterium]|jgi:hypothetical protein|nr:hypothetical protein [Pseudobdellovibrionaceae bacterium]